MARILRGTTPQLVLAQGPWKGGVALPGLSSGTTTGSLTLTGIPIPSDGARIARFWFRVGTVGSASAGSYFSITPVKKGQTTGSPLSSAATALTTTAAGGISSIAKGPATGGDGYSTDQLSCTEGDEIDLYVTHSTTATTAATGITFNVLWEL